MVNRLLAVIVLLMLSSLAFAADLTARVDRFEIGIDESVELTVTLADAKGQRPDLTELLKDFSIVQHSQGSNLSVDNGVMSTQANWIFLLSPNRKGTLSIPAFKIGSLSTDPIEIKVGDNPVAQSTSGDLLMEVEVKPLHPYVQGQVIYIQRLYYSRPLVDSASISRPKISKGEGEIEYLGFSGPRYVTHNGRPYQLRENYFAVFPKQAGPLHFEPSVFRGSLASSNARQNRFSMPMFNRGSRVSAYSAKAELTITDKPASFTGEHWLPASQVTLNMNWSQSADSLKAGEPVTVTIALMAEGAKAETLPEVKLALPDSLKVYPEQPSFRSDKGGNGLSGLREEKFTVVGNEAGEFQIPAVEIPWWNTNTDKQEVARLDGFTIKVEGTGVIASKINPAIVVPAMHVKESTAEQNPEQEGAVSALIDPVATQAITGFYAENKVLILSVSATFTALLGGLVLWRRRFTNSESTDESQKDKLAKALSQLATACRENNAQAAVASLPVWANEVGIYPATLAGVERSDDSALIEAVRDLTKSSYSQQSGVWSGEALLKAINAFSATKSTAPELGGLSPLHPIA